MFDNWDLHDTVFAQYYVKEIVGSTDDLDQDLSEA